MRSVSPRSSPPSDPRPSERGAGATTAAAQDGGSLTVLDWAGYDAEEFWIDFKKPIPNVDVKFEIGASDADIYAKMKAGDQADVFHPYTGWLQFYVEEGLVEEIDTTKLTNWDKVPDNFKAIGQINGKQYFIPWDWGLQLDPLSHRQNPRGHRLLGGADEPEVYGPHLDVG